MYSGLVPLYYAPCGSGLVPGITRTLDAALALESCDRRTRLHSLLADAQIEEEQRDDDAGRGHHEHVDECRDESDRAQGHIGDDIIATPMI